MTITKATLIIIFSLFIVSCASTDFEEAKQANTYNAYQQFINKYQQDEYELVKQAWLLQEDLLFKQATDNNRPISFAHKYLAKYGRFYSNTITNNYLDDRDEFRTRLTSVLYRSDQHHYNQIKNDQTTERLNRFVNKTAKDDYRYWRYSQQYKSNTNLFMLANTRIETLDYQAVINKDSLASYYWFLDKYHYSTHKKQVDKAVFNALTKLKDQAAWMDYLDNRASRAGYYQPALEQLYQVVIQNSHYQNCMDVVKKYRYKETDITEQTYKHCVQLAVNTNNPEVIYDALTNIYGNVGELRTQAQQTFIQLTSNNLYQYQDIIESFLTSHNISIKSKTELNLALIDNYGQINHLSDFKRFIAQVPLKRMTAKPKQKLFKNLMKYTKANNSIDGYLLLHKYFRSSDNDDTFITQAINNVQNKQQEYTLVKKIPDYFFRISSEGKSRYSGGMDITENLIKNTQNEGVMGLIASLYLPATASTTRPKFNIDIQSRAKHGRYRIKVKFKLRIKEVSTGSVFGFAVQRKSNYYNKYNEEEFRLSPNTSDQQLISFDKVTTHEGMSGFGIIDAEVERSIAKFTAQITSVELIN